jgi:hypothetical protein
VRVGDVVAKRTNRGPFDGLGVVIDAAPVANPEHVKVRWEPLAYDFVSDWLPVEHVALVEVGPPR